MKVSMALEISGSRAYSKVIAMLPHAKACPICQKPVSPRRDNPSFPFCSPRCRQVDLGRWLGEEYRVPERQAEEREDEGGFPSEDEGHSHLS
jgi:endogenous inhibitor of DNA gyrase (YacG/DUF329 family)